MTEIQTEKIVGETEQKHITEVKFDMSGIQELIAKQNAVIESLNAKIEILTKEKEKLPPVVPELKEDKTKGIVKEEKKEEIKVEDGLVLEKSDFGKGFQVWRDYTKENSGKFKRLVRG